MYNCPMDVANSTLSAGRVTPSLRQYVSDALHAGLQVAIDYITPHEASVLTSIAHDHGAVSSIARRHCHTGALVFRARRASL